LTSEDFEKGYEQGKFDVLKKMFKLGLIWYSRPEKVYFVKTEGGGLVFIETEVEEKNAPEI
jgi:hypothetical protein